VKVYNIAQTTLLGATQRVMSCHKVTRDWSETDKAGERDYAQWH